MCQLTRARTPWRVNCSFINAPSRYCKLVLFSALSKSARSQRGRGDGDGDLALVSLEHTRERRSAPSGGEGRRRHAAPPPPRGGKTKHPTQSEVSIKVKAPPKQAPSGAAASPLAANPTGGPSGAGTQGASPKGAPPPTASRSLTDRLACKEEGVFALLAVQPRMPGSVTPGQPAPAPTPAVAAPSPAATTAPNPCRPTSCSTSQLQPPAAPGGGVATASRSVPASAKITGPYPSTTRDAMAPGPFAPSSAIYTVRSSGLGGAGQSRGGPFRDANQALGLGGGTAPFRDANQALGLTARPRQAVAAPGHSPVRAAPSQASPVQAAPSPGQSVTLTLPPTWGPGKQLRLRFGDGACTSPPR